MHWKPPGIDCLRHQFQAHFVNNTLIRRQCLRPHCNSYERYVRAGSHRLARRRCFSSSSITRALNSTSYNNPYPFPNNPDPTPYQIFHLLPDASPDDVKTRYYELVKLYHPDSSESRKLEPNPSIRHAQFSAITRAYKSLQKRAAGVEPGEEGDGAWGAMNPWKRAPSLYKRRYEEPRFVDERWKDRVLWVLLGLTFVTVAAQTLVVRTRSFQDFRHDQFTFVNAASHSWKPPEGTGDPSSSNPEPTPTSTLTSTPIAPPSSSSSSGASMPSDDYRLVGRKS